MLKLGGVRGNEGFITLILRVSCPKPVRPIPGATAAAVGEKLDAFAEAGLGPQIATSSTRSSACRPSLSSDVAVASCEVSKLPSAGTGPCCRGTFCS